MPESRDANLRDTTTGDFIGERECVTHHACDCIQAERDRYRAALEDLADPESWSGNPLSHDATLHGHFTPYELARNALNGRLEP